MTLEEARQQIDTCERQITKSYIDLKDAVRDMGLAGLNEASSERERIEREANGRKTKQTMLSLLILLFGLILFFLSHFVWGILFIIGGIVVTYQVYQSAAWKADKEIEAAENALNSVNGLRSSLNSMLDNNRTI